MGPEPGKIRIRLGPETMQVPHPPWMRLNSAKPPCTVCSQRDGLWARRTGRQRVKCADKQGSAGARLVFFLPKAFDVLESWRSEQTDR